MRVMVSRSTFSWDQTKGTKASIKTREQKNRADLFMIGSSAENQSAIIQLEIERTKIAIVKLFEEYRGRL
jgi:hypothetical protein